MVDYIEDAVLEKLIQDKHIPITYRNIFKQYRKWKAERDVKEK